MRFVLQPCSPQPCPAQQVITGDDWNLIMFAVVEHKPVASLIYFVVVIVIGTYLFVNLFIASETRRAAACERRTH
jgi:hypothetical protein